MSDKERNKLRLIIEQEIFWSWCSVDTIIPILQRVVPLSDVLL